MTCIKFVTLGVKYQTFHQVNCLDQYRHTGYIFGFVSNGSKEFGLRLIIGRNINLFPFKFTWLSLGKCIILGRNEYCCLKYNAIDQHPCFLLGPVISWQQP